MNESVAVLPDLVAKGSYDGYGKIGMTDLYQLGFKKDGKEPDCYHKHCWEYAGKPTEYKGGSKNADDQGFFFDDEHDVTPKEATEDIYVNT